MTQRPQVLMVLNDMAWFWSHRLPLAQGILDKSWKLKVATAGASQDQKMKEMGVHGVELVEHGHLLSEFALIASIFKTLRMHKPDIVHAITLRHAFYTALISRLFGYNGIYTIAGLGSVFSSNTLKAHAIRFVLSLFFRLAFRHKKARIIFQNPDDFKAMRDNHAVGSSQSTIIKSSGVDLSNFAFSNMPTGVPRILFSSRLIKEKGLHEFVEASRLLKAKGIDAKFEVAGMPYPKNPNSHSESEVQAWHDEGLIHWHRQVSDMPNLMRETTLFVLPSYYREGVPKVVIEAMASGRPIITTDMPGCRETVEDGVNGFLVLPKDAQSLAEKIESLLANRTLMEAMGKASRAKAEKEFAVEKVVEETLKIYDQAIEKRGGSMNAKQPVILLGLNEVNFDMVHAYADEGHLPHFKALFDAHPVIETTSEQSYEELEPWIQWVSIQTGKPFSEHKIFRLGDMTDSNIPQLWEHLENNYGAKVAAVSPMNAANRAYDPAFFVPDPWTKTSVTGDALVTNLTHALAYAVNTNATGGGKAKLVSYLFILVGALRYSVWKNPKIVLNILKSLKTHYERAIFLDQLLTDVFTSLWRKHRPDFSSLFLNSSAHIQHHYLFNSKHYKGANKNPEWYMDGDNDPVLDAYKNYDDIVGRMMKLPDSPRFVITTGLHQSPVGQPVFYWRLKNHASFLDKLGVRYDSVLPRMSRDFLIEFATEEDCKLGQIKLESCTIQGKQAFGLMDNRGRSLFVTLSYPDEIKAGDILDYEGGIIDNIYDEVGFVAIKNGEHDGKGYLIDTGYTSDEKTIQITDIFHLIDSHFS
ncbi:MAG: glycosyltransferase family 4 protein, partial [Pseudomonadota bacterium]